MASITHYGEGWRAHLFVAGRRESRLFKLRREAERWAAKRETELRGGGTALTFAEAAERWLSWRLPGLSNANSQRTVEQSVRDYVLPVIGKRRLNELRRADLVDVVRRVAAAGKVETAHRLGQRIRAILDHAVDHGDIESHPGAGLSRVLPAVDKTPMAAVTPAELPALMKSIDSYPEPVTRLGLLLLAHTFTRTSELIGAQWAEIRDTETWVIPGERMKRGLPHVVPLSRQVRAILDELRSMTEEESPYILASGQNPQCSISNNTLLFALYRLGYKARMTGHGFRAVASTVLNESKLWGKDAIERQLAHRETDQVREAYHRAEYLEERRTMMAWWSDYLDESRSRTHE
ncbi:MAG: tyrosine-type recombinase/integrase [Pseudomonadota bacterium]|jgi:integrase|nr:tyrosine-type recombinase/integrase [Pseudomonadota bacterium]